MTDFWLRLVLALVLIYIGIGYNYGAIIHAWLGFRVI